MSRQSKPICVPQSLINLSADLEQAGAPDYPEPPHLKKPKPKKKGKRAKK